MGRGARSDHIDQQGPHDRTFFSIKALVGYDYD
jgi:hypothetical protein